MKDNNSTLINLIKEKFYLANYVELSVQDTVGLVLNFSNFSRLLIALSKRRKEAKNV